MPLVRIGVVNAPFGVRGELKCEYTTDHPEWIPGRSSYLLLDPRSSECLELQTQAVKLREQDFLIHFAGFDAPEPLKRFTGWELVYSARRGELPRENPDEVYLFELAGLEVRNPEGAVIGVVKDILDTGPHFLLELDLPGEPLIPYIDQHIVAVNLAEGYLISSYPLEPDRRELVEGGDAAPRRHAPRRPRTARGPSKASVQARRAAGRRKP